MKTGWNVNETEEKLVHFKLISVVTTTELLITWRDNNRRSKMLVEKKVGYCSLKRKNTRWFIFD